MVRGFDINGGWDSQQEPRDASGHHADVMAAGRASWYLDDGQGGFSSVCRRATYPDFGLTVSASLSWSNFGTTLVPWSG
jgi:hypothetical protein